MIRVVVVVIALCVFVYAVQQYTLQNHRETTLEREKEIGDAIRSCGDLPWFERLNCDE